MAKPYTVKLKGGGSMTVNASDPQAARDNVVAQGGTLDDSRDVAAGGHRSNFSGTTDYAAGQTPQGLDPQNSQASNQTGTSGPGATAANKAAAAPGTIGAALGNTWANTQVGQNNANGMLGNPAEYEYGMRPDDTFTSWAQRSFRQGTKDFGPSNMNPFIAENGAAQNPYQQWFQSRYGTSAGMNNLVAGLLGNQDFTKGGPGWQGAIQGQMQSNNFGPTDSAGAAGNLNQVRNLVNGSHTGADAGRMGMLDALQQDPSIANQMVLGQYSNVGGPLMGYLAKRLNNLGQQYSGSAQQSQGSYWDMLMKMLGQ